MSNKMKYIKRLFRKMVVTIYPENGEARVDTYNWPFSRYPMYTKTDIGELNIEFENGFSRAKINNGREYRDISHVIVKDGRMTLVSRGDKVEILSDGSAPLQVSFF